MRCFFITQDTGLPCAIQFRDFDINGGRLAFTKDDGERMNNNTTLYLAGNGREARADLIQRPVTMFSYKLKDIIDAYEADLLYKDVTFIHLDNKLQYNYVQVLMDQLDALSDQTELYPNETVKRLVLDANKIGEHHIFMLAGNYRKDPIISLPLAESLLRRNITGIRFEEVEVR